MILYKQYLKNLASKGQRISKRKEDEYREIVIEKGVIEKAEGSARVRIGKTEVIVGVKMGIGQPYPDKEDEGVLITGAELSPLASPDFELGPPREDAIELARVVDRGIRESGTIDTKKLCIEKGEKVWMINMDIQVMNHSGNLIDASALAAVTALWDARMPELKGDRINYEKKTSKKLPVKLKPVTITLGRIGNMMFTDPDLEEEKVIDSRLSISFKDDGNMCAMQKSLSGSLSKEEIDMAFDMAAKKSKELRKPL